MSDHVVARGETLGGIAAHYGTTWQSLAAANNVRDANLIRVGQHLKVPDGGSRKGSSTGATPERRGAMSRAAPPAPPLRAVPGREGTTKLFVGKLMKFGSPQAKHDFDAGKRVVVALRVTTSWKEHFLGVYDDKIAVLRKLSDGTVRVKVFDGNTEINGTHAERTHKKPGRLVLGSYRFRERQEGQFPPGRPDVAFRATRTEHAIRDTNRDGIFDTSHGDRIDRTTVGTQMLIHRGWGEKNTGSEGCQTIKPSQYKEFLAAIAIGRQKEFSYVLAPR